MTNDEAPERDIPTNPAKALERIFGKIRASGQINITSVWTSIIGVNTNSLEFVSRHSAVVKIVDDLRAYLVALPADDNLRQRYESDIPLWYKAVVPRQDWSQNYGAAENLVTPDTIRLLGSLGDIIAHRLPSAVLTDNDLSSLLEALGEWRFLLDETQLPESLKEEIRAQVSHIEWLINTADLLGYTPIVKESRTLLSMGFSLLKYAPNIAAVFTCMSKIAEVITHLNSADYGEVANAISGAVSVFGDALEARKQMRSVDGQVVDAEVVD